MRRWPGPVPGAIAQATGRPGLMTAVTCPILRYHPTIVAQVAAMVALFSARGGSSAVWAAANG